MTAYMHTGSPRIYDWKSCVPRALCFFMPRASRLRETKGLWGREWAWLLSIHHSCMIRTNYKCGPFHCTSTPPPVDKVSQNLPPEKKRSKCPHDAPPPPRKTRFFLNPIRKCPLYHFLLIFYLPPQKESKVPTYYLFQECLEVIISKKMLSREHPSLRYCELKL